MRGGPQEASLRGGWFPELGFQEHNPTGWFWELGTFFGLFTSTEGLE